MGLFDWLASLFQKIWASFETKPCSILLLGLDAAGKTTIVYRIKLAETVSTIPTVGFNVETVELAKGMSCTIWDVGGQERIRHLWRHFFANAEGIIYVVDSIDSARVDEAKEELYNVLSSQELPVSIPLLFLANKQDMPGALTVTQLVEGFDLVDRKERLWHAQGTCAVTGDGLHEGFTRLSEMINQYREDSRLGRLNSHARPPPPSVKKFTPRITENNGDWQFV